MIQFILDTDMVSLDQRGHPAVSTRVTQYLPGEVGITVISVEEQLTGWYAMLRRVRRRDELAVAYLSLAESVDYYRNFTILPFPESAILRFETLRALKLNVGGMDLRIAAITLEAGCTLVTRNARDFGRIPGLKLDDWSR